MTTVTVNAKKNEVSSFTKKFGNIYTVKAKEVRAMMEQE